MTYEREYDARLEVDGLTIDRRDLEMLAAIDRCGSMHAAAEELGRSYARLQRRIVAIEDAVGPITERRRGGSGGGGTVLTPTARELRRRFERHEAGLEGVARVTESVFSGQVLERSGELATVETRVGEMRALVPEGASAVDVGVRSDAVVLTRPAATPESEGTSLRNRYAGTVASVESGEEVVGVTVALELEGDDGIEYASGDDETIELRALITRSSREKLELEAGEPVVASFKATATRATRIDSDVSRK